MTLWLRVVGILLLAWIPISIGFRLCRQIRDRQETLLQIQQAMAEMESRVRYYRTPIVPLLETLAKSGEYSFLDKTRCGDDLLNETARRVAAVLPRSVSPDQILQFLSDLSSKDTESALERLQAERQRLSVYAGSVKPGEDAKAALFGKLGLLASAFVITLLI